MNVVSPATLGPDQIVSSTAANEYPDWEEGQYQEGERVTHGLSAWEALRETDEVPGESESDWLRLGYANRYRMFFDGRDSPTTAEGSLDVTLFSPEIVTTVALLGLTGVTATLIVDDPLEGVVYEREEALVDIGVPDYWEWHFLPYSRVENVVFDGIPPYAGANISVSVDTATESGTAAIGRIIAGVETSLGITLLNPRVEMLDFSTKERDPFGNLTLVKRRVINLVDYDVTYMSGQFDHIVRTLRRIASEPTLFIGTKRQQYRELIVFGVFRSAIATIPGHCISEMTIQVEEF